MKKILFTRNFQYPTGGHVTVRDYFMHSLNHPEIDPYIYFTPESKYAGSETWQNVPQERIVKEFVPEDYDLFFVGGKDWRFLPFDFGRKKVINIIQGIKHAKEAELRSYLKRPAYRICNSHEVHEAILPFISGVAEVIHNAVDFTLFHGHGRKNPNSVLIWGLKNIELADQLYQELKKNVNKVRLLIEILPQKEFAKCLQHTDILVALPSQVEGFYKPALEGMASRCAVICADAIGNRCHCIDMETCLQPKSNDFEVHILKIRMLLDNSELKEKIRYRGYEMSQKFTLDEQRRRYYQFLEKYIL